MLVTAEEDKVIPQEIIERYQLVFTGSASDQWIVPGAAHQLAALFTTKPDLRTKLVTRYVALSEGV